MLGNENVFEYRQIGEKPDILKGAGDAELGDLIGCGTDGLDIEILL